MTEPTPQEIAARVRGMAQELADARAALHLKPGQPLGDRIRGLTEELDGRATSIEALRGDLDAVRAALSLAERKVTDRAQERSAMWAVLLAVREASGAGENDDLRAVVASLRAEAAHALPSRMSGLPQPAVAVTDDDRIRVEIRHGDVGLQYLYDRHEAARLVHDLSLAVARLTPGGPRLGVNADPGEGATLGICVEIAGEVLHLSPSLHMEGPQLEALVRELTAALPPVKHAGEHLEPLLAPLRPAGVLGRGALTEATPARVIQLVLERVNADRREIERLRKANAGHADRAAWGADGKGKRKQIAELKARHAAQRETIKAYQDAAKAVAAAAESAGLLVPAVGSPSPSAAVAAAQDLAALAKRAAGLEELLTREREALAEARREFAELHDAARTMLPEGSTPNPATSWLADVIRGAPKRVARLEAKLAERLEALHAHEADHRDAADKRCAEAEVAVARLAQPAVVALPPALRPALDALQDKVDGVEATPEGLAAGVLALVSKLNEARGGWGEESGNAARARTELAQLLAQVAERDTLDARYSGHRPTGITMGKIADELGRVGLCVPNEGNLDRILAGVRAAVDENRRLAGEVARLNTAAAKLADPEAVRVLTAQANTARQLADEVRTLTEVLAAERREHQRAREALASHRARKEHLIELVGEAVRRALASPPA